MVMRSAVTDTVVNATIVTTAETVIAQIPNVSPTPGGMPIALNAFAAITTALNTTGCRLRIRRDSVTGTVVGDTGNVPAAASTLIHRDLVCDDYLQDVAAMTYVLTAELAGSTANPAVSAAALQAFFM